MVEQCQFLLRAAEDGQLRGLIAIGVGWDGDTVSGVFRACGRGDVMRMLGEVACLQQRLLDEVRAVNGGEC